MNFSILLLLLDFIRLVFSTRCNNTEEDSCNVCTLPIYRRKRANTEYTRWYANAETKQEFIVQVLEDDITPTSETKQIAAVNIQPVTKGQEKIIIRGVQVTNKDFVYGNMLKDYTRFVPPTTLTMTRISVETTTEKMLYDPGILKPKLINRVGPEIINRNSEHEIGPPMSRQYAPISAVSFRQRKVANALTPRTVDRFMSKTTVRPTRTSLLDISTPIRTSELVNFLPFNKISVSRSTATSLMRTSAEEDMKPLRKSNFNIEDTNKNGDKESDTTDNDIFYNDDDINEKTTSKRQQSFIDNDIIDNYFNSSENALELEDSKKYTSPQKSDVSYEDEDYNDSTIRSSVNDTNNASVIKKGFPKTIENEHYRRNLVCNVLKLRQLSFSSPLTLHEIVAQMKQWATESPVAKWLDITKGNYTVMENPIYMMLVDDLSSGQIISAKKTVMIVAGIQGRDHHAVTAAMYVLYQLIERSEAHSDLLSKYRFWIIPVFNPDGYDYSMTFPQRRQWSKNLRQTWDNCKGRDSCEACEEFGIRCTIQPCYGVNLDRNFEYQWIPTEELRMEHPCGVLYAGPRQLSEAETAALTRYLHEQRLPLYTFIAFKEGDVLGVMYPYSHTKKKRAFDHVYRQRASQAASAAYSISGRPYVAGQTSEFLPLYAGGIEDWVDGHLGIDNTYTVMLFRPTDTQNSKLVTERVVHEAYAAVDTLLLQSAQGPLGPPVLTLTRARGWRLKTSATPIILVTLIILGHG